MTDVADHQFNIGSARNRQLVVAIEDVKVDCARVYSAIARIPGIDSIRIINGALKGPFHILTVLAIEVCTRGVKMAAGWVPARMGAHESGAIGAFAAFGLSPASYSLRCRFFFLGSGSGSV